MKLTKIIILFFTLLVIDNTRSISQPEAEGLLKRSMEPKNSDYSEAPAKSEESDYSEAPAKSEESDYSEAPPKSENSDYNKATERPKSPKDYKVLNTGKCGFESQGRCNNRCCSRGGWCGNSPDHCLKGCNSTFGVCGQQYVKGDYSVKPAPTKPENPVTPAPVTPAPTTPAPTTPAPVTPAPAAGASRDAKVKGPWKLSKKGIDLIKSWEGFYANFYKDAVGIKTIGYGTACHSVDCSKIKAPVSEATAVELLVKEAKKFEDCINKNTKVPISQNMYDALVSFVYNLGCGCYGSSSSVLRKINAGDYNGASNAIMLYNKAGGRTLQGLTNRRTDERNFFNGKACSMNGKAKSYGY